VRPFAWMLGTWRGEGVGGYPTIDGGDFRYGEEIVVECYGKPVLSFTSTSWSLDDDRPLARQAAFWRPTSPTELEVVMCLASGLVEVLYGRLVDGPAGQHVEMESDLVARTTTAKEVTAEKRMYAVRGGKLMYAVDMAAVGQPMTPHLSAALDAVS
jgi:THAP4-like, heme-binding beta-barrel domain